MQLHKPLSVWNSQVWWNISMTFCTERDASAMQLTSHLVPNTDHIDHTYMPNKGKQIVALFVGM